MDLIDVHNTIDTMKFSSFVYDYMYDDDFHDLVESVGITPLDFLEQKVGEALDPIDNIPLDDYDKAYSHIVAAKDNLQMLLIDYYNAPALDDDNPEQDFVWALGGYLDESISDSYKGRDFRGVIAQGYVIEDFKRDFFDPCTKEEMADRLHHRLSDFFYNKEPYSYLAEIEGLFPEGVFDKLKAMDDDPYDYYDYQMSGAIDDKYTGATLDDKAKHFNLGDYLDGLRSITGYNNFSMQDTSCVYSRLTEAFAPIRDEILKHKDDKDLSSLYSILSDGMNETFVAVADKVNKIKPNMLADWFEEELGVLRQEVDMIGLMNNGHVTKKNDDVLLLGMLCERYYDENFARMGFSSNLKHYQPHIMSSFLDAPDVSDADKFAHYKKYRDIVSVDEVYDLDKRVGYRSWDNKFTLFRDCNASFGEYCNDYSVSETSLKNRRYLEDAAYAQGRGLTSALKKDIYEGLNGRGACLERVDIFVGHHTEVGQDFLANMNAVSGIVGDGICKAFREAGDDRGYGFVVKSAIDKAKRKHLDSNATVNYVRKCGASNLIYNSIWAGMNSDPIDIIQGLAYSRVCASDEVHRYDVSDDMAINIVRRYCSDAGVAMCFENATNGTADSWEKPEPQKIATREDLTPKYGSLDLGYMVIHAKDDDDMEMGL